MVGFGGGPKRNGISRFSLVGAMLRKGLGFRDPVFGGT